eukprot:CAMPEP_0185192978 /NCGR_PEP_ID=MMETSP1140-20130426/20236_1 /TAXON_ID=298111 /ORGANISM="Pavlova sp., Strain CCMP459" /LENGTH=221 /DNA_ID=CAMNT_0027759743 /DNA_START=8 /DNA_END=673 /DNA_ORIENTATION=-
MPALSMPSLPNLGGDDAKPPEPVSVDSEPNVEEAEMPANTPRRPGTPAPTELAGVGAAGLLAGGILGDVVATTAGVSLSGEVLTDAAALGGALLGGFGIYAATRPDEAGELARTVGGGVANVSSAYVDLAKAEVEYNVVSAQRAAVAKVEQTVDDIKAIPTNVKLAAEERARQTAAKLAALPTELKEAAAKSADDAAASLKAKANERIEALGVKRAPPSDD